MHGVLPSTSVKMHAVLLVGRGILHNPSLQKKHHLHLPRLHSMQPGSPIERTLLISSSTSLLYPLLCSSLLSLSSLLSAFIALELHTLLSIYPSHPFLPQPFPFHSRTNTKTVNLHTPFLSRQHPIHPSSIALHYISSLHLIFTSHLHILPPFTIPSLHTSICILHFLLFHLYSPHSIFTIPSLHSTLSFVCSTT